MGSAADLSVAGAGCAKYDSWVWVSVLRRSEEKTCSRTAVQHTQDPPTRLHIAVKLLHCSLYHVQPEP